MIRDFVFDIDGTLADPTHRRQFVRTHPRNWPAFNAGIPFDDKHEHVIFILNVLAVAGHRIIIATARQEHQRQDTEKWLHEVAGIGDRWHKMYMRADNDYRDDSIVKREILAAMRQDGYDPYIVFDDRDRVVNMWREEGIKTFQVEPGDF